MVLASESMKMASETEPNDSGSSNVLAVNLQIVSPSVGVNRPLLFPELSAATTIKQLKDKIRHALPLRPADENQRLIHRGRALLRESDSLLDIFGADALQSPDRQTIHLVLRDPVDSHSSSPALAPGRGLSPATDAPTPTPTAAQPSAESQLGSQAAHGSTRRTHSQPAAATGSQAHMPSLAPFETAPPPTDPTLTFQQQHQNMTTWLSQIQREAMARAMVHQNQRERAQMGMRGIGDQNPGTLGDQNGGRASPAPPPTHTIYRETIGPNGQTVQVQVETVVRSAVPNQQNSGLSPMDVQNMLRGVDANQATATFASVMQRSASGTSIHGRPLNQHGVATPFHGTGVHVTGSGRATPDLGSRFVNVMGATSAPAGVSSNLPRQGVEVYILSSPEGPRAVLVNNSTSETYYTPRLRPRTSMPHLRNAASFPNLAHASFQVQTPQNILSQQQQQQLQQQHLQQHQQLVQQQLLQHHLHQQYLHQLHILQPHLLPQQPAANIPQQTQPRQPSQPAQVNYAEQANNQPDEPVARPQPGPHPGNPPAAGIPPLLLQAWPHIWLMIRLAVFVWLFTTPASSWSRWFTVLGLAVLVFLFSSGLINGVAANAWRPLGRHLENLLPAPEQHVRRQQQPPAGLETAQEQQSLGNAEDLDPARMAARLVAEHERRSWFGAQLRRLERAGLLFLASIAPGVAERHIANLEAETQAEETRRRESAEAAAAAAATAAAAAAPTDSSSAEGSGVQDTNEGEERNEAQAEVQQEIQRREEPPSNDDPEGIANDLITL